MLSSCAVYQAANCRHSMLGHEIIRSWSALSSQRYLYPQLFKRNFYYTHVCCEFLFRFPVRRNQLWDGNVRLNLVNHFGLAVQHHFLHKCEKSQMPTLTSLCVWSSVKDSLRLKLLDKLGYHERGLTAVKMISYWGGCLQTIWWGNEIAGCKRSLWRGGDEILNTQGGFFMQGRAEGLSVGIRRCLMAVNSWKVLHTGMCWFGN